MNSRNDSSPCYSRRLTTSTLVVMRPMPIVLLLLLSGSATGCGESKKGESDDVNAELLGGELAGLNEQKPSELDNVVAEAMGDEFAGLKKTDSEKILADPGGTPDPADFAALSSVEQGLALNASIAEAQYETGKRHLEARELKEAIAALKEAVKNNPNHGWAFLAIGQAHGELGDANSAKRAFEKAIEVAGDTDEEWLAEAYRLLGYAIRESNGSRSAMKDAWVNYLDRVEVESAESKEVQILLIPLRAR